MTSERTQHAMSAKINLADYIERRKAEPLVEIELGDGSTIAVLPAELWPDAAHDALANGDQAASIRLILGDDDHARFVAEGGNWMVLSALMKEAQGVTPGESQASSG